MSRQRKRGSPSGTAWTSGRSWTSWLRRMRVRRLERRLQATRVQIRTLARREAHLLLRLQLEGLTLEAQVLRVEELLQDLRPAMPEVPSTPEPQPRHPEPLWQVEQPQVMHSLPVMQPPPEELPPPAEDQLRSLLGSQTTTSSSPSSEV